MMDLYIVGAGGFGRELLNIILDIHAITGQRWNIKGFLDDTEDPLAGKKCDFSVAGTIQDYFPQPNDILAFGIASPAAKLKLVPLLKSRGARFETIIHPYVSLGRNNTIGEGCVFYPAFGMTVNVSIGNFVMCQSSSIGHDAFIGDYCSISSGCSLLGAVTLEEGVFVGTHSVVAPKVKIGSHAYICMGSIVLKNVPSGVKMLGNPAREIGYNEEYLEVASL